MTDTMKRIVAIDGPTGAGKSTIAKLIAKNLGFNYLDTGALYRAIALALRNSGMNPEDSDERLMNALHKMDVSYSNGKVFLQERDVTEDIRSKEIDHYSSVFSARKVVRDFLLDAQRNTALKSDIVVEGRDTATVVFPDAKRKIYLDASLNERAKRRYLQLKNKGVHTTMEESKNKIRERDARDSTRDIAPLKIAPDALYIDSSNLSIDMVKKKILEHIKTDP